MRFFKTELYTIKSPLLSTFNCAMDIVSSMFIAKNGMILVVGGFGIIVGNAPILVPLIRLFNEYFADIVNTFIFGS